MKEITSITHIGADSYVGRFVAHHLSNVIKTPEKYLKVNCEHKPSEHSQLVVWSSTNPTGEMAVEVARIAIEAKAEAVVMVSSTKIYAEKSGENINELAPLNEDCESFKSEHTLAESLEGRGIDVTFLRLPELTIGTGMTGLPERLVKKIYRNTYRHIKGTDVTVSVLHASSVGPVVEAVAGTTGIYNLTDRRPTSLFALTDALSYRIGKRIFTTSLKQARILARISDFFGNRQGGSDFLKFQTSSLTFSAEKLFSDFPEIKPVDTIDYLRNHVYDENSL